MASADDGLNIFDLPDNVPAQDPGSAASAGAPEASPTTEPNGEAGSGVRPSAAPDPSSAGESSAESVSGAAPAPDGSSSAEANAPEVLQVNGRPYEIGTGPGQIAPDVAQEIRQKREFQARADRESARLDRIERENERLRQQLESVGQAGESAEAPAQGAEGAPERPTAQMSDGKMQELLAKAREYDQANGYEEGEGYGNLFGQMIEQIQAARANQPDAQDAQMVREVARRQRLEQDYETLESHMEANEYDLDEEVLIATQGGGGERVPLREAVRRYYLGAEEALRQQGVDEKRLSDPATRNALMQRALAGANNAAYRALRQRMTGQTSTGQQQPSAPRAPLAPPGVAGQASTPRGQAPGAAGPASRPGLEIEVVDGDGQAVPSMGPTGDRIDMIPPLE